MDERLDRIKRNIDALRAELPAGVTIVAAAKTRTPDEVLEAVRAGIAIVGENYVQEAAAAIEAVGRQCRWHLIGRLQRNKVKRAVEMFDMIQTVDSPALAADIDRRAAEQGKVMPVLIEVNSGREPRKSGVLSEELPNLVRELTGLKNVRLEGLMTMGPESDDPEDARPCFRETRRLFEDLGRMDLPSARVEVLSMGMTQSYRVAVEEGANMVRLGTLIFGPRD